MSIATVALKVLLVGASATAVFVLATNWPSRLDLRVAMRYLRSRRSSRLLSLITVIAVGGVTIGVMARVMVVGIDPDTGTRAVTSLPHFFKEGDLSFRTTQSNVEGGVAIGTRLASK